MYPIIYTYSIVYISHYSFLHISLYILLYIPFIVVFISHYSCLYISLYIYNLMIVGLDLGTFLIWWGGQAYEDGIYFSRTEVGKSSSLIGCAHAAVGFNFLLLLFIIYICFHIFKILICVHIFLHKNIFFILKHFFYWNICSYTKIYFLF